MKDKKNIIISYILSKGLFFGLGISYIINNANKNSGLAIIIGYLIGGIILYFIKRKKIYNIKNSVIGKLLLLLLILIIYITILLSFTVQTINFYLPQTPSLIIAITFLLVCIYGSTKDISSYKRLNQLLIYISILLTIIGIIGNINNVELSNFKPLFYDIDFNIIKAILAVIILSITPNILLLNIDNKVTNKELLIGYFLGGLNILLLTSSTIGTLGLTLAKTYRYPEYIAFEKIVFFDFIERIENILAFIWQIDLISIGILTILNIKTIIKRNICYIIYFLLTILTVLFFINIYQNTMLIYHYIFYVYAIILGLLFVVSFKRILMY